jgi:penicillin-binding protein 2
VCDGSVVLHGHPFRCWQRSGHGSVGLERSLEVSCDVFYYLLGQRLGIESIATWLERFGFGQATGLGIGSESSGLVGTPEWSRRARGLPWFPGTTVSVSIGQGPVLATALQLARAYAALANGGRLVRPHMVSGAPGAAPLDLDLDPALLRGVVAGLEAAIHGAEGTARRLAALPVAGKTGTAQVVRLQEGVKVEEMERRLRHHAWFVGWAPLDEPRWVVSVLVEHGGGGGGVAAPVAGEVLRAALAPPPAPLP